LSWTVLTILRTTTAFLEERDVDEPRLSAEHLLADVLDCRRLDLYLGYDRPLDNDEVEAYRSRVRRRMAGEPIQYITGVAGFRSLELVVDRRVLIPRPETEQLVGEVVAWVSGEVERGRAPADGWTMLDMGTGSGAIACSLAAEVESVRQVVGTDVSRPALEVARTNAARVGAERTRWLAADGLDAIAEGAKLDVIVANPPYIAVGERPGLPAEVADWEPEVALFAGEGGREVLDRIVAGAARRLRVGGLLAMEIGEGQADAVRERILHQDGLVDLAVFRDYAGRTRGVLAIARTG
jgi:release factor glutamine methyltransferase